MQAEILAPRTMWHVECHDKDGKFLWEDDSPNIVTDVGINDLLNQYFKGSAYTATWFVGLANATATYAAADTMASHAGWTENVNYTAAGRPSLTLGTVANKTADNSAAKATFTINGAGGTIGGVFLCNNSTKSGTNGTLYCEANFTSGNKVVAATDVLSATVTVTGA